MCVGIHDDIYSKLFNRCLVMYYVFVTCILLIVNYIQHFRCYYILFLILNFISLYKRI